MNIQGNTFIESLSQDAISKLIKDATSTTFHKGDDIVHKGQEIGGVYIVTEGKLRIYTMDSKGNEKPIYHLTSGEICIFSVNSVLKEVVYPAWVSIDSEQATILSIPTNSFRRSYDQDLCVREYVLNSLSNRIFDLMSSIEETSIYEVPHRINSFLVRSCPNNGILALSHQEIADNVGTAREVVSRHLKNLEHEDLIILSRRKIEIPSPEKLALKLGDSDL